MRTTRKVGAVLSGLIAALFLATTLMIPAFEATGPAILMIAFAVLAWALWPKTKTAEAK